MVLGLSLAPSDLFSNENLTFQLRSVGSLSLHGLMTKPCLLGNRGLLKGLPPKH